ncbi:MAG: hypothetical protein ACKO96_17765, partial [Flammeovirgaceae bacterium]
VFSSLNCPTKWPATLCVYDGCGFRSRHCPLWVDEVNKTKLHINLSPAAGINTVLATVGFRTLIVSRSLLFCQPLLQCPTSCRLSTKPNSIFIESSRYFSAHRFAVQFTVQAVSGPEPFPCVKLVNWFHNLPVQKA